MNPVIQLKQLSLVALLLACFALSQSAQAVVPPPDGGYPNFTTAEGTNALQSLTTGSANTAVGWSALLTNAAGSFNTATGAGALLFNTADDNTAFGAAALLFNTTGFQNTAIGTATLLSNTNGDNNTAIGDSALQSNTTSGFNTAIGDSALQSNTTGGLNTATGGQALQNNTTANNNTANGVNALRQNTTASNNTAIGFATLVTNTTGDDNTALGSEAGRDQTTGSRNVYIGRSVVGIAGESDKTYIRNINITALDGAAVTVDVNSGLLGHATSSRRYKEEIKPMDKASEALYQLKPVTFHYKKEINRTQALSFGLIAEEVAEVNPDLIVWDSAGKPETVRYEGVNAMLLNEFLKARRQIDAQQKQIEALTSGLQKVSAQLEASKPAPQVVNNP
jgi:hypothetical protein